MMNLYKVSILIYAISSIETKNLNTQSGINDGLEFGSNDWYQQKWNSILKQPKSNECSERLLDNEFDENSSREVDCSRGKEFRKKIKYKTLNELENFAKDEMFPVGNTIKKQSFDEGTSDRNLAFEPQDNDKMEIPASNKENYPEYFEKNKDPNSESLVLNPPVKSSSETFESNVTLNGSISEDIEKSSSKKFPGKEPYLHINVQRDFLVHSKSFIFNPDAQSNEQFQNCTTLKNESGTCRYLQHCMIPSIVGSLNQFLGYVCIIKERFIGVCCPSLPVTVLVVKDQKEKNNTKIKTAEECGISTNTRIVGGLNADPKAWPWMVALLSKSRKNFFCGGALINNRYVLTAAHCTFEVPNNEIVARLGEYDFRDDGKFHDDYTVVEIKRHGRYNRRNLRNDIALLKLEKPVVFTEFIKTICLPEEENDYVGETATLAGWGNQAGSIAGGGTTSHVLQEASFPVQSNEECAKSHGIPMPPSLICTSSKAGDKGACNGDSGGPLMLLDKNNRWKVVGIVSWGRRGCNPEFSTVYTRASHFLEWIKKHSSK